jgi:nucleotide-binding universal stress UspA family protein
MKTYTLDDHLLNPSTILVLANETADSGALLETIERSAGGDANVLVVAPALNSRLRHWTSDEDDARVRAKERLQRCVERLDDAGVEATGMIGDADPLQALRDALAWFPADLLIVATHPAGRSNWLATKLVERASRYFAGPILHVTIADAAPAVALAA